MIPFGQHAWITPRYELGAVVAHQMSRRLCGHERCAKELRRNVVGGEVECLRMLKTWALWGLTCAAKDAHTSVWATVVADAQAGLLLPMEELDAQSHVLDLPSLHAEADLQPPRRHAGEVADPARQDGTPLLGKKDKDTPQHIHDQMEALAARGNIPITTPAQRARCMTSTSIMGVPTILEGGLAAWIHRAKFAPSAWLVVAVP